MKRVSEYLSLVKFSHSIFALPFALQSAWLAARGLPAWDVLFWIVFCAVSARTAAMGFNRLVDRAIDARNPRTAERELPAGRLGVNSVRALVLISSIAFVGGAVALNPLAGKFALPVLFVLLGYSLVKRFSAAAHLVLGLALALAPLGAWIAVRGTLEGDLAPVLWLAVSVLTWVAGFDLIYSCQDAEFDRAEGLHSIPARFGIAGALRFSAVLHILTAGCLGAFWWSAELGWIHGIVTLAACVLLVWEHSLVKPDDLSRVNMAFFTMNGWVGVGLFLGLVLDLAIL